MNSKTAYQYWGSVLDPIVSVRWYNITFEEDETIMLDMMLGIAGSRDSARVLLTNTRTAI